MWVNMVCPSCGVEVSAHVDDKVIPLDGPSVRYDAFCLKCRNPVGVFVSVTTEPVGIEPPRLTLDPSRVGLMQKQMREIARRLGYHLSWRKIHGGS